jgi:methyl-accepting chemotaxis protein
MIRNMRVSLVLLMTGCLVLVALGVATFAGRQALDALRIGSPLYTQIVAGKDLVADILPPPAYIIESYLEATLALVDPATADARAQRVSQLKREYLQRHEFWLSADFDRPLQQRLTTQAHVPAMRFFNLFETAFIPALKRNDKAGAERIYQELSRDYALHRGVVDQIVVGATRHNAALEAEAAVEGAYYEKFTLIAAFIAALASVGGLLVIRARVLAPIEDLTRTMGEIVGGRAGARTSRNYARRGDEIGRMAAALETFGESVATNTNVRETVMAVRGHAADAVKDTTSHSSAMSSDAVTLANSAERVRLAQAEASEAAQRALSATNLIAASTEELSSSISEIAENVSTVARKTAQAVQSGSSVRDSMTNLSAVVHRISDVVSVIGDIADRTNLLALNATIEAARAGDSGKGFAIVAQEVKQLSRQTTVSTEEIRRQIEQVLKATQGSVSATDEILGLVRDLDSAAAAIAAVMHQQSLATGEIARNANESLSAVREADRAMSAVGNETADTLKRIEAVKSLALSVSEAVAGLGNIVTRIMGSTGADGMGARPNQRHAA